MKRTTRWLLVLAGLLAASRPGVGLAKTVIDQDTSWTVGASPWPVVDDIVVAAGTRLTIEAGVTVELAAGRTLTIEGELIAIGSETQPIVFTGVLVGGERARWGSLIFSDSSVDARSDANGAYVSGSILSRCTFEYGTRAVVVDQASPWIEASTFRMNRYEATADVRGGAALSITGGSAPRVRGCTFSENVATGAGQGGAVFVYESSPILQDNTFRQNRSAYGGALTTEHVYSPIVGNVFEENVSTFEGGAVAFVSSAPAFLNNRVSNNSCFTDGGGVHVCVTCYPHANPLLLDNTISDNRNGWHVGAAGIGAASIRVLSHNNIFGNQQVGGRPADFAWFNDLAEDYPPWVANPQIANNWWGTTDTAAIDKTIVDGADDAKLGKVDYLPVLAGPVTRAETRATITTRKIRYQEDGEGMPVYLTIYNPGPARVVDLVLLVGFGEQPPIPYRGYLGHADAEQATSDSVRLSLAENSVFFTKLLEPSFAAAGLTHGYWHAAIFDASGQRIGEVGTARFELGAAP